MTQRSITHSWDVAAAEREYISQRDVSYGDIAVRHEISLSAVKRYARQRDWPKRRRNATENGLEQFARATEESLADTNNRHLSTYQELQGAAKEAVQELRGLGKPKPRDLLAAANVAKLAIEGERVVRGLPVILAKSEVTHEERPKVTAGQAILSLDKLIARKKRLEELRSSPTEIHD